MSKLISFVVFRIRFRVPVNDTLSEVVHRYDTRLNTTPDAFLKDVAT